MHHGTCAFCFLLASADGCVCVYERMRLGNHEQDLQGQDQVIGVADTGVDMNHCHFREDDDDNIEASSYNDPVTDLTKRKVVQYIAFVDDFDGEPRPSCFLFVFAVDSTEKPCVVVGFPLFRCAHAILGCRIIRAVQKGQL